MKKKKIVVSIFVSIVVLVSVVTLIACQKKNKTDNTLNMQELYSTNIVASLGLLNHTIEDNTENLKSSTTTTKFTHVAETTLSEIDFDTLIEFVKGMSSLVHQVENQFQISTSDKPEYSTKIIYHGQNMEGKEEIYTIYYNEVPVNEQDRNQDLDEVETQLSGVAYAGDREFKVMGSKEVEQDEIEIELQIQYDNQNYVEISQEKENGEIEYEYKIVKNGQTIREFELEFKTENDKTSIEICEELNGVKSEIEIEATNTPEKLKITIEINHVKEEWICETISASSGEIQYQFTNTKTNQIVIK